MVLDPYREWLNIRSTDRPPTHYDLLGVPRDADSEQVRGAAVRRTAQLRPRQLGDDAEVCARLLNEVSAAFAVLADPEKRRRYDELLGAPIDWAAIAATRSPDPRFAPNRRGRIGAALGVAVGLLLIAAATLFVGSRRKAAAARPALEATASAVSIARAEPAAKPTNHRETSSPRGVKELETKATASLPATPSAEPSNAPASDRLNKAASRRRNDAPPGDPTTPVGEADPVRERKAPRKQLVARVPPPAPTEQRAARARVRARFGDQIAERDPAALRILAAKLLKAAESSRDGALDRYAMANLAMELAGRAGDPTSAYAAADFLALHFDVDARELKFDALSAAARHVQSEEDFRSLAESYLRLIDEARVAGNERMARQLLSKARSAARRSKDAFLLEKTNAIDLEGTPTAR